MKYAVYLFRYLSLPVSISSDRYKEVCNVNGYDFAMEPSSTLVLHFTQASAVLFCFILSSHYLFRLHYIR